MPLLRPVYTCNFCRALRCNFCRKCKLAAISLRFLCDLSGIFVTISPKSPPSCIKFPTCSKPLRRTATNCPEVPLKSPLVYTCDFYRELERDKNYIEKCNKSCIKNCMCKRAFIAEFLCGRRPPSKAPWVRKFGNLSKREILVVTSAYACPPVQTLREGERSLQDNSKGN